MTVTFPDDDVKFEGFHGDTFQKVFTIKDSSGTIINLTGATFRFLLGALNESSSGVTVTNGNTTGQVTVTVTYTAMEALTVGDYDIALEMTDSNSIRTTLFTGTYTVLEDVR